MRKLLYLTGLFVLYSMQSMAQANDYVQIQAGSYQLGDTASLANPKRTVYIE